MGKREAAAVANPWGAVLRGVAIGALAAVFLLGVCAVLLTTAVLPEGYMTGCVLLACVVGTLIGGRIAMSVAGKRMVLWGVCVGLLTAVLLGVSGFLLYGALEPQRCVMVGCACLCGGGAAGMFGRGGGKKRGSSR